MNSLFYCGTFFGLFNINPFIMKTFIFILSIVFFPFSQKAQNIDTTFNYQDDYILNKIIPVLPHGWTFKAQNNQFIISRNDSVVSALRKSLSFTIDYKISKDSILKYGQNVVSEIIYKYEHRWTFEQTTSANSNNIQINQSIKKLPEKYGITNLLDKSISTRFNSVFTGNTEKEKQLIYQYEKEKNELMSKLIKMPNYHTEKYSLFLYIMSGCNDDNYCIYPEKASQELYDILTLFMELSEN